MWASQILRGTIMKDYYVSDMLGSNLFSDNVILLLRVGLN